MVPFASGLDMSSVSNATNSSDTYWFDADLLEEFFTNKSANDSFFEIDSGRVGPVYIDPIFYSLSYKIIGTIFQGIVLVVGVLGNVMVVIVVMQTRGMHTPTNCYLVSLSCADLVVLLFSVPNEIFAYYLLGDEWIWGWLGCMFFIYFQYMGINASALSITAFTVERYIAICQPMKAQTICTVNRAKKIIISVWIFAIVYCSPWLFLTKTKTLHYKGYEDQYLETCTFKVSRKYYLGLFFADLVLFYLLPLLLSVVLYSLIAMILFSNQFPKTPGSSKNGAVCTSDSKKTNSSNNSRVQVVKMLVVVVAVFAIFWLPYRLLVVYNSLTDHRYMELWFLMFCKTMIFMNSAINPILYNAMSVKFRRAFKRMLSCNRHRPGQRSTRDRNRTQTFYTSVAGPVGAASPSTTVTHTINNGQNKTSRAVRSQHFSSELISSPVHTHQMELASYDSRTSRASSDTLEV